jgi:hypothetical protein
VARSLLRCPSPPNRALFESDPWGLQRDVLTHALRCVTAGDETAAAALRHARAPCQVLQVLCMAGLNERRAWGGVVPRCVVHVGDIPHVRVGGDFSAATGAISTINSCTLLSTSCLWQRRGGGGGGGVFGSACSEPAYVRVWCVGVVCK